MGIHLELFVEEVHQDLICSICQDVVEGAVKPLRCMHIICYNCITDWMNTPRFEDVPPSCPMCRTELTTLENLTNLNNRVGNMVAKCPNGCGHQTPYDELVYHLAQCNPLPCPGGCGFEAFVFSAHNCVAYLKGQLAVSKSLQRVMALEMEQERGEFLQIRQFMELNNEILTTRLNSAQREIEGLNTMTSLLRREVRESVRARLASTQAGSHSMVLSRRRND